MKKKYSVALVALLSVVLAFGQKQKASPPASASQMVGDLKIEIDYHQPGVKDREVWGSLVPYNKVWRTGANNATTFEINKDVTINGQALPAGKYALFTIPTEGSWTVIFNKEPNQWGAYDYNESKDALRVEVNPEKASKSEERLTFDVTKGGTVNFAWEYMRFSFDVKSN